MENNKRKSKIYLKMTYGSMAGCLVAISSLLVIFLYFFQQMRDSQNIKYSLPFGWSIFLIFALVLLVSSLLVLVFSIYLNFENSKKIKAEIEEQNKIEIEKIKNGEISYKDETSFNINHKLETDSSLQFKNIKTIQYNLYSFFIIVGTVCSIVVFVILFSLAFLLKKWFLLFIFAGYFLIPLLAYLAMFFLVPYISSNKNKKANAKEVYEITTDKIKYIKIENDSETISEEIDFKEFEKAKETDKYFFFISNKKDLKHSFVMILKSDVKDIEVSNYLSLKVKQINGSIVLVSRGDL